MSESMDDRIMKKLRGEIQQNTDTAIKMLCATIADPGKFKDLFEWSYFVGKLFSTTIEGDVGIKENRELLYSEAGEAIIDNKIEELLKRFNVKEKTCLASFLLAAATPLTQEKIDVLADYIKP